MTLNFFFNPKGVAVIGASRERRKPGHVIFRNFLENLIAGQFKGEVYPINPKAERILGMPCYSSVLELRDQIDLVVIAVPAPIVPKVLEESGKAGAKGAIIISSGFSEVGNIELEHKIVNIAHKYGMRIIGPNCVGIYDAYSGVDTIFLEVSKMVEGAPVLATPRPKPGKIALITQSGAFGATILDYMAGSGLGISKFISHGNRCDVDEVDLIRYLAEDEHTEVILIYLESIRRGREFFEVAREVTKIKPIVALKVGRTSAGARAAASHTGALAGSDEIFDAAFRQSGIIRAEDTEEFMDLAKVFANQLPAKGKRIAIITDGGGLGVMAADAIERLGGTIEKFSETILEKLDKLKKTGILPEFAAIGNPIDVTGVATAEMFAKSIEIVGQADEIDGILLFPLHHIPTLEADYVERIVETIRKCGKPVIACDVGEAEMAKMVRTKFDKFGIPAYPTPERAARSMMGLVRYGIYLVKTGVYEKYLERKCQLLFQKWNFTYSKS
ncbi:MAG: CoA-binding protein [archaeon GB-1867-035]|nr:CoA-binding protein [Candidatus Culexmicrobium profundum]